MSLGRRFWRSIVMICSPTRTPMRSRRGSTAGAEALRGAAHHLLGSLPTAAV